MAKQHNEVEEVREHLVADMVIRGSNVKTDGNRRFIDMSGKFVNLDELNTVLEVKLTTRQNSRHGSNSLALLERNMLRLGSR